MDESPLVADKGGAINAKTPSLVNKCHAQEDKDADKKAPR